MESHLPIIRAFFLSGPIVRPATRERLLRRLEMDLAG